MNLEDLNKRCGGDDEILSEMLDVFLEIIPGQLERVRIAVEEGNAKSLMESAHTLKGSLATITAYDVSRTVARLEAMGREKRIENADELYRDIARRTGELIPEIKKLLDRMKADQ